MTTPSALAIWLGTVLLSGPAYAGADPVTACKNSKAKAVGKTAADILKAAGNNLRKSNSLKLAADVAKAESKFTKAFAKAEDKGGCLASGDRGTMEDKVHALAAQVIEDVGPTCGNDLRGGTEACDGDHDTGLDDHDDGGVSPGLSNHIGALGAQSEPRCLLRNAAGCPDSFDDV